MNRLQRGTILCCALIVAMVAAGALAAPSVSSTSGTFTNGQSVTISGSNFGTKSTAAPCVWDNFESGTNGANISGENPIVGPAWGENSIGNGTTRHPTYTSSNARSGSTRSSLHDFTDAKAWGISLVYMNQTPTAYFTFWYRNNKTTSNYSRNTKPFFVYGTSVDHFPDCYIGYGNPDVGDGSIRENREDRPTDPPMPRMYGGTDESTIQGEWLRWEQYIVESSSGVADGTWQTWVHRPNMGTPPAVNLCMSSTAVMTRTSSYHFNDWEFGSYWDQGLGQGQIRLDDIYFDTTQARVEIGNASTWSTCTYREIQRPTAWSSSSITAVVNVGQLPSSTAWLYVVDSTGAVNSSGYAVTIGSGGLPTVTMTATDSAASETGPDTGTFRVTRTGSTSSALAVNYTISGTAASGDYTPTLSGTVTIASGSSTADITITPVDDSNYEGSETVILTISTNANYTVGSPSSATVTIADNDKPTVTITATDASASETGPDAGTFTVSRTGITTSALAVNYAISGTATNTTDYSTLSGTVTINSGSSTANITITPVDDALVEGSETVILTISANANYTVGSPSNATVTIADNDSLPTVTITATDAAASETGPDTGTFQVSRTGATTSSLVVNYAITGTATNTTDYSTLSGTVTINSGSSTANITITPVDDATVESSETVILTISANANYTVGSPSNATVTIADNDSGDTTYSFDDVSGDGTAITGVHSGIDFGTGNWILADPWGGFTKGACFPSSGITSKTFSLPSGKVLKSIRVTSGGTYWSGTFTISSSGNADCNGTFVTTSTPQLVTTNWTTAAQVVTVYFSNGFSAAIDDIIYGNPGGGLPTVTINATDASASETGPDAGTFTVTRTGPTTSSLAVNYAITGTATNTTDYSTLSGTVTINSGSSTANITVTPVDDAICEGSETVILTISTNANYTVGNPSNATVTIADNDLPTVTIAATDASASETGPDTGTFTVTRTGPTTSSLVVNYAISGTATNTTDYLTLSGTVTINSGSSTATITVTPVNDSSYEGSETVILTLSANANYTVGNPSNATVTIADNDNVTYSFSDVSGDGTAITGVHSGIDFGTGNWILCDPWGGLTKTACFPSSGIYTKTFSLPAGAVLKSIRLVTSGTYGGGTYTISSSGNTDCTGSLTKDVPVLVTTNWTTAAQVITVYFSCGWSSAIDDITYGNP